MGSCRLTLREIAKHAGVSPSAVSLVRNGKEGVSESKRVSIESLLKENGYAILKANKTEGKRICLLKYVMHSMLVDGNTGFVTSIIDSAENELRARGYSLYIICVNSNSLDSALSSILSDPPLGILLLGTELPDRELSQFCNFPCPVVVIDNPLPSTNALSSVTMDNFSAIFQAVQYLRTMGHTDIGFLSNAIPSNNCLLRERAFLEAIKEYFLVDASTNVYAVDPTMNGAFNSISNLISEGTRFPTAIIANNDCIALGAQKAFKAAGYRIPEDISIIGFDGLQFSEIADPPLTTISVPCDYIGRQSVQTLLQHIDDSDMPPVKMCVCTNMILRQSVKKIHNCESSMLI